MVANSSVGDMNTPPEKKLDKKSLSWELWENISKENPEYGNPKAFISDIPKIEWTSFTITFKESLIKHLLKKFVHNQKTAFT
jgi:oleate hydratase